MFTWTRSATRLIYALARQGVLPRRLAKVDQSTGSVPRAAFALAGVWAVALLLQFVLRIPVETYIQLASGSFLLTYVVIILTAWRLLRTWRYLPGLLCSSLAILVLVLAGIGSMWYALLTAALFALVLAGRRRFHI
jgi:amino acid transporter